MTQQFNTTTSMGRLTLNVLLSFAQFERELSSERVRDKIAASRAKGKWTGGSVPLGYDVKDKKLVPNPKERETVCLIFRRYLELGSFQKLVDELDRRKIVSKRRSTIKKPNGGGVPFTYGPLAYLLKNRIYIGEISHKTKWYPGEHEPIIERKLFDHVQQQLADNAIDRTARRSESGALLMGRLFDDRGNVMSPSYSTKNGGRYRFYVSAALLRGRKLEAGSVARTSATEIERTVIDALRQRLQIEKTVTDAKVIATYIVRAELGKNAIKIITTPAARVRTNEFSIPWQPRQSGPAFVIEPNTARQPDAKLVQALVRAHTWLSDLRSNKFETVEALAAAVKLHPKVVRQELRYAFLAPAITEAILNGDRPAILSLGRIPKTLPLAWSEQRRQLGV